MADLCLGRGSPLQGFLLQPTLPAAPRHPSQPVIQHALYSQSRCEVVIGLSDPVEELPYDCEPLPDRAWQELLLTVICNAKPAKLAGEEWEERLLRHEYQDRLVLGDRLACEPRNPCGFGLLTTSAPDCGSRPFATVYSMSVGACHPEYSFLELTRFCGHLSIGDFSPRKGSPHGKDEAALYAGVPL